MIVIGAGIVGLCTAHALARAGHAVTLLDPEAPGSQCSSGNAGALSSGSVVPLAMPGLLKNTAGMLLDPTGPLHIPFHYWARGASWLLQFARAARPERVERIAAALQTLLQDAVASHERVAAAIGRPDFISRSGQLHLYPDAKALAKDAGGWAMKQAHGLRVEHVDAAAIRALEPNVRASYTTGVFLPDEASVNDPLGYAQAIAADLRARGARFEQARVTHLARGADAWQVGAGDRRWQARHVVVSAGAWSTQVLASLGLHVPLQTQRGYHLQLAGGAAAPAVSRVVVLADRKVFMNPMRGGLRIAGTVEIDALDRPANARRAELLREHARAGLQGVDLEGGSVWMGHRPCLPDSMPVLGPVPAAEGLWCAFGHGHLGLTESVNTGDWIAAAIAGQAPAAMAAFSLTRFRGWRRG
ncbi:FAD-dependent oxidoreductase [Bordetella sp. N]|nr:FAD-dependent oxidoreductase [Bordetella sp. N]